MDSTEQAVLSELLERLEHITVTHVVIGGISAATIDAELEKLRAMRAWANDLSDRRVRKLYMKWLASIERDYVAALAEIRSGSARQKHEEDWARIQAEHNAALTADIPRPPR